MPLQDYKRIDLKIGRRTSYARPREAGAINVDKLPATS